MHESATPWVLDEIRVNDVVVIARGATAFGYSPAFFLFVKGKDVTIPKGAEITAYVNGEVVLELEKFHARK